MNFSNLTKLFLLLTSLNRCSDASAGYIKTLKQLGATVSENYSEGLTHLITTNGSSKRALAAEIFNIKVVSPLWVHNCAESGKRVPENDFLLSSSNSKEDKYTNVKNMVPPIREPRINEIHSSRNVDSPFFSSSQRQYDIATTKSKVKRSIQNSKRLTKKCNSKMNIPSKISSSTINSIDDVSDVDFCDESALNLVNALPIAPAIPLPAFQPYILKSVPSSPTTLNRRRSERICDIYDRDDEDDNDIDSLKAGSIDGSAILDPDAPIPIIYDKEWPPNENIIDKKKQTLINHTAAMSSDSCNSSVNDAKSAYFVMNENTSVNPTTLVARVPTITSLKSDNRGLALHDSSIIESSDSSMTTKASSSKKIVSPAHAARTRIARKKKSLGESQSKSINRTDDIDSDSQEGKVSNESVGLTKTKVTELKSLNDTSTSSSSDSRVGDITMYIAITGFNDLDGDRTTLQSLIIALIKLYSNQVIPIRKRDCATVTKEKAKSNIQEAIVTAVYLNNDEDIYCDKCTHVVAADSCPRTLRILFANGKCVFVFA